MVGYQAEIDSITRRTKYAENSFLSIYKLLADAPDPTPLFEAAVEQSGKLVDYQTDQQQLVKVQHELYQANQRLEGYQAMEQQNQELLQSNQTLKQTISQLETKVIINVLDRKRSRD